MNFKQENGMILLTTLSMMAIIAMLVLSLMQSVFLYIRVTNALETQHETLSQLEAVAKELIEGNHPSDCVLSLKNFNQINDLLLKKKGCSKRHNHQQYHYLINDLGTFPCLQITADSKQYFGSHHWLITVANELTPVSILQLRVAKLTKEGGCELEETRIIKEGVLSWRYITQA